MAIITADETVAFASIMRFAEQEIEEKHKEGERLIEEWRARGELGPNATLFTTTLRAHLEVCYSALRRIS